MAHGEKDDCSISFDPPVFRQRYSRVTEIIIENNCTSVIDLGCAECTLVSILNNNAALTHVVGVDINMQLLKFNQFKAKPLGWEFIDPFRLHPFNCTLYCGDVSKTDARLLNHDAVVAVELIEHLNEDELAAFPNTVFGYIRPRIVVITTPNSEYNTFFNIDSGCFRHWDHKFEWNRAEFEEWCQNISSKYDYFYEISFVGYLKSVTRDLGGCSQLAVFSLNSYSEWMPDDIPSDTPYTLVAAFNFPYDSRSLDERREAEVQYAIDQLVYEIQQEADCYYQIRTAMTPLSDIFESFRVKRLFENFQQFNDWLISTNFYPLVSQCVFSTLQPRPFSDYSSESSEYEGNEQQIVTAFNNQLSLIDEHW